MLRHVAVIAARLAELGGASTRSFALPRLTQPARMIAVTTDKYWIPLVVDIRYAVHSPVEPEMEKGGIICSPPTLSNLRGQGAGHTMGNPLYV